MTESAVACQSGNARAFLGLPSHQRIRAIRSERWVPSHPRVQKAIQVLEQILDHPRATRMPSIVYFLATPEWARRC